MREPAGAPMSTWLRSREGAPSVREFRHNFALQLVINIREKRLHLWIYTLLCVSSMGTTSVTQRDVDLAMSVAGRPVMPMTGHSHSRSR
jgi:hypothetical protein